MSQSGSELERLSRDRDRFGEALEAILNLPYPQRNPDGDEQYVESVRLIARDALHGC